MIFILKCPKINAYCKIDNKYKFLAKLLYKLLKPYFISTRPQLV